ncbi:hypothetical protein B0H11DRAFT_2223324 [Mycena galericulata]|nr:hypothetical protein B0H11DRAFT_2223324 [Mycena galericulata]
MHDFTAAQIRVVSTSRNILRATVTPHTSPAFQSASTAWTHTSFRKSLVDGTRRQISLAAEAMGITALLFSSRAWLVDQDDTFHFVRLMRERIRPALFILEACSWSPGDKSRPPPIPQDEELAIRDWLSALHGSLAIAGVFRSRALVRLADIPQEKRLGSDDVYRYSLFGQATHIFEIFREISYRFPPIARSEDAARRRAWFHMEEMELVCCSIADMTGGERDFPEYDAGGYYRGFRDSFEFPFAFLDRIGDDVN